MEKRVRVRIASQFTSLLKLGGLTTREHGAKVMYEALPPAVKAQMAEQGKARLKAYHKAKQA